MTTNFPIQSSDPQLLAEARRVADAFARPFRKEGIAGIAFLGGVARGYFDHSADIDIALFASPGSELPPVPNYQQIEGFEIHSFVSDYAAELNASWDMAKRWAFSSCQIDYDPQGLVAALLAEKVPLRTAERNWLMIEGMTQSDWYINTLTDVWVERGSLLSAHHMFAQGVTHFFETLFALNNQLVADVKWQAFCVQQLPLLPPGFQQQIGEILLVKEFSREELARRRQAFMGMWQHLLPLVEQEVQMTYAEFGSLV